jgi:cobalamin synthase
MRYFKQTDVPVYFMVDLAGSHMAVVTQSNQVAAVSNISNLEYITRQLNAMEGDTTGTYIEITSAAFFTPYLDVWEAIDNNHTKFFQHHFEL